MDKTSIKNTLLKIFQDKKIIQNTNTLDLNAPLQEIYGLNSINFIEIIVSLEEIYNFEFDNTKLDIENFNNVNSIISTVFSHLNKIKN